MRFLCLLLPFLAACGRADARETNLVSLAVEFVQGDSARVIARWSRPCDGKGCVDSYRVAWAAGAVARSRTVPSLADTLFVARPAVGDTLPVSVSVTSIRRGLFGAARTASTVIRNPDAPPPPIDSLRVDTLAYEAAMLDSFPDIVVRDSLGQDVRDFTMRVGDTVTMCALARHRYTGEVRIMIPPDITAEDEELQARLCETARRSYSYERGG